MEKVSEKMSSLRHTLTHMSSSSFGHKRLTLGWGRLGTRGYSSVPTENDDQSHNFDDLGRTTVSSEEDGVTANRRTLSRSADGNYAETSASVMLEGVTVAGPSRFRFVSRGWFQAVTACIIFVNVICMVLEMTHPTMDSEFEFVDRCILFFYVFEFVCRMLYYRCQFLCGPTTFVMWNVLDIAVVCAGVVDEWMVPMMPGKFQSIARSLRLLRALRALRLLKGVRILLEADLSWAEQSCFQSFVGFVITLNSLFMGVETDISWSGWLIMEQVFLLIYLFEVIVQLKRYGWFYLSWNHPAANWNYLDFVIVVMSVLDMWLFPLVSLLIMGGSNGHRATILKDIMMLMRMLRLMRILRLIKLVKAVRPLYILVTGVLAAMQGVAWVLVLTVVTLYALAIVATRLIGHGIVFSEQDLDPRILIPFKTVPDSMFTLFRVMSGASSGDQEIAINMIMSRVPTIKFGFVFFMVTSSWTLLSILTAVVSENMITTTTEQASELRLESAEADRRKHIAHLKELFKIFDHNNDGVISEKELDVFLGDQKNAQETARVTRVPLRDVREVLSTLAYNHDVVSLQRFVESLTVVGQPVTEKSVMKLEARLLALQHHLVSVQQRELAGMHEELVRQSRVTERLAGIVERCLGAASLSTSAPEVGPVARGPLALSSASAPRAELLRAQSHDAMRSLQETLQALRRESVRTAAYRVDVVEQLHVAVNAAAERLETELIALQRQGVEAVNALSEGAGTARPGGIARVPEPDSLRSARPSPPSASTADARRSDDLGRLAGCAI